MAIPLPDDIKTYVDAAIKVCDQRVAVNVAVASDVPEVAADKVERIAMYNAIKTVLVSTYAL